MGTVEPAIFWMLALVLCLLAFAFVVVPGWLSGRKQADSLDRRLLNIDLFKQRLAELEQEQADSKISEEEFTLLKQELEQSLLEEIPEEQSAAPAAAEARSGMTVPLSLGLAIPLIAIILYADFGVSMGSLEDLVLTERLRVGAETQAEQNELVDDFRAAMLGQPDNHEGWYMLGQSFYNLERYSEAAAVFKRLKGFYPGDGNLAGSYAEALFMANGRQISPAVDQAINAALEINPHQLVLLEIRAMAAFESGDSATALRYFRQALNSGASGRQASILEQVIARLEADQPAVPSIPEEVPLEAPSEVPAEVASEVPSESKTAVADTSSAATDPVVAAQGRQIVVSVGLADDLGLKGNEAVFIFARAFEGPPMPLAVQRLTVAALPATVQLTEAMAMMPNMSLASFDRVEVVARISRSGSVDEKSELIALSEPLNMTQMGQSISLTIALP